MEGHPEDELTGDVDVLGGDEIEGARYEETDEELKEDGKDAEERDTQNERDEL
ncbi:hypothetical protein GH890_30755 [Bacillus thuringiensis]|nr:hypothetical protein [Bacillus thuringiensis]